ncbi:Uncharacterised protein [Streptococcus pneumoniae]|nr:Uncharacterised protein [Streptococcus pneumoniae]CJU21724.1 Uncharacterised protein [Streptococcus pneumoniae]
MIISVKYNEIIAIAIKAIIIVDRSINKLDIPLEIIFSKESKLLIRVTISPEDLLSKNFIGRVKILPTILSFNVNMYLFSTVIINLVRIKLNNA